MINLESVCCVDAGNNKCVGCDTGRQPLGGGGVEEYASAAKAFLLGSVCAHITPRNGFIQKASVLIFTKGKMFKVHYPNPKCCH